MLDLSWLKFFVFDVYDIDREEYLDYDLRHAVVAALNKFGGNIEHAPVIGIVNIDDFKSIDDFLAYAERPSIHHPIAEGVVFKSISDKRHSFKVISNKFILKEKD